MNGLPRPFLVKKIKFTHISNTRNSIRENFIQDIKSEKSSSQYFSLNDLTALSYDQNNDFSLFHLSINSLQYHFEKLQTFYHTVSLTTTNIQIPGFSTENMLAKYAMGNVH